LIKKIFYNEILVSLQDKYKKTKNYKKKKLITQDSEEYEQQAPKKSQSSKITTRSSIRIWLDLIT
jgi:hypothetical protein